jgi:nucleoside-diphosphate-sugar epimerase
LPDFVMGQPANPRRGPGIVYSTYSAFMDFYKGHYGPGYFLYPLTNPPTLFVSLQDTALAHIIALAAQAFTGERIFAMTGLLSARDVADAILKLEPGWKHLEDVAANLEMSAPRSNITVPNERFVQLIRDYVGREPDSLDAGVADMMGLKID